MLNPITVTTRQVAREYKKVFEKVKETKQPAVVAGYQVAIISQDQLKDLEELEQQKKNQQSTKSLLETARKVHKVINDSNEKLPEDLSLRHDYYLYEE